jgi:Tol biopolymer transport system component
MVDIPTGKETTVTTTDQRWLWPHVSPKGDLIAYVDNTDQMFLVNLLTNTTEKVGANCGPPTDISSDGDKILFEQLRAPIHVMMIDIPRARSLPLVRTERPGLLLFAGRFSPDTRWVAFHASLEKSLNRKVFISPIRDGHGLPESEWIPVSDGSQVDKNVAWSPDGNLLYFLSERDGRRCIWAQRLQPATKQPVGSAFVVQHFHDSRQSLSRVPRWGLIGITAVQGRLVFTMSELTGDIWMEERRSTGADWLRHSLPAIFR